MKITKIEDRLAKEALSLKFNRLNAMKARLRCLDAEFLASIRKANVNTDFNQQEKGLGLY